jgi:hypothetical protein
MADACIATIGGGNLPGEDDTHGLKLEFEEVDEEL